MGKSHKIAKESRHEGGGRKVFQNDKQKDKRNYSKKASKRNYKSNEEIKLTEELSDMGYTIKHMDGDGNCLFRSFADQLIDDDSKHFDYRLRIMSHIKKHKDHFSLFVEDDEPFDDYVDRMKGSGEWGGHPELYAASQCLNVNILVHQVDGPRFRLPAADIEVTKEIHLSYHGECHYNSVRSTHPATTPQPPSTKSKSDSDRTKTKDGKRDKLTNKNKNNDKLVQSNSTPSQSEALQVVSAAAPWASVTDILSALDSLGHCVHSAIDFLVSLKGVDVLSLGDDGDVCDGNGLKLSSAMPIDNLSITSTTDDAAVAQLKSTNEHTPHIDTTSTVVENSIDSVKTKKALREEKKNLSTSSEVLNKAGRSMSKKELRQQERQRLQQAKSGIVSGSNSSPSVSDTQNGRSGRSNDDENDGSRVEIVL